MHAKANLEPLLIFDKYFNLSKYINFNKYNISNNKFNHDCSQSDIDFF